MKNLCIIFIYAGGSGCRPVSFRVDVLQESSTLPWALAFLSTLLNSTIIHIRVSCAGGLPFAAISFISSAQLGRLEPCPGQSRSQWLGVALQDLLLPIFYTSLATMIPWNLTSIFSRRYAFLNLGTKSLNVEHSPLPLGWTLHRYLCPSLKIPNNGGLMSQWGHFKEVRKHPTFSISKLIRYY